MKRRTTAARPHTTATAVQEPDTEPKPTELNFPIKPEAQKHMDSIIQNAGYMSNYIVPTEVLGQVQQLADSASKLITILDNNIKTKAIAYNLRRAFGLAFSKIKEPMSHNEFEKSVGESKISAPAIKAALTKIAAKMITLIDAEKGRDRPTYNTGIQQQEYIDLWKSIGNLVNTSI